MIERSDLEERVETTHAQYIGCHGDYWNAMRFGPGPVRRSVGTWPLPHIPSYSDAEKETKRQEMERCKSLWEAALSELKAFDDRRKQNDTRRNQAADSSPASAG